VGDFLQHYYACHTPHLTASYVTDGAWMAALVIFCSIIMPHLTASRD
jgi:hypothetical protein